MSQVLAVFSHPDDIELLCAGTLHLLVKKGWKLRCVTMTGGDLGSSSGTRDAIRKKRLKEAKNAATVLGGSYSCAGLDDLTIYYCPEQLAVVTEQVRLFSPDIVITHSPDCYMLDHEETSRLVRMAVFKAGVPLFKTKSRPTTNGIPALYYADALERKDKFGKPVKSDFWIDITTTFNKRQESLACHVSQREWLRSHHGVDNYLISNEKLAREGGQVCGVKYAEGFRQHLGHGYPEENRLADVLKSFAPLKKKKQK